MAAFWGPTDQWTLTLDFRKMLMCLYKLLSCVDLHVADGGRLTFYLSIFQLSRKALRIH
jgi:hypothetical protein